MPKLTLLLGRRTLHVYDFKQASITIGRDEQADVRIDNPSVSRRHAEIRLGDGGWVVEDLGSSNGTFLRGNRLQGPQPIGLGDEIGFGKFSIVFGKALAPADGQAPAPAGVARPPATPTAVEGTMHIRPHEVKELLKESDRERRAHLIWESGGRRGTHYLRDAPAVLIGTDDLCDVRVPKAPKHHVLVVNTAAGCDVRFLGMFASMSVRGRKTKRAALRNGDVVKAGDLKLTFMGEVA
jgi:hypothetical protein